MKSLLSLLLIISLSSCTQYKKLIGIDDDKEARQSPIQSPTPPSTPVDVVSLEPIDFFVAAGQSNMVGRWYDEPGDPLVFMRSGRRNSPAWFFGKRWSQKTGKPVAISNCAVNGSDIQSWMPGQINFQNCVEDNIKEIKKQFPNAVPKGILFYQGETDASTGSDPIWWADSFLASIAGFRQRLGNLPVLYVQIGEHATPPLYWSTLQTYQEEVFLTSSKMISAKGLSLGDHVHLTSDSYKELGQRLFEEMQILLLTN